MMNLGALLDDGSRDIAQALTAVIVAVALLLAVALLVVVSIVAGTVPGIASVATAAPQPRTEIPLEQSPEPGAPRSDPGAVETAARRYLGVPYVFGGTDPARGLDCSGLVQLVFRNLGITLPRTAQLQYNATSRVTRDQLQPGDLVFFARTYTDPNDWITHVGIYIGGGLQINAPTDGEVVSIQPVFTGYWGAHFASGGRIVAR